MESKDLLSAPGYVINNVIQGNSMDQDRLYELERMCIQECPPGCTSACPVHVDVRAMISAVRRGDYSAGYSVLRKSVLFPGIISRTCVEPCRGSCKRNETDEAIEIRHIERICVDRNTGAGSKPPVPPLKEQKVAVIGAGLSGLTVAADLAQKGFPVTVFESSDRIGGKVRSISSEILPADLVEKDFSLFEILPVEFKLNERVGESGLSLDSICGDFDAVYIATGSGSISNISELFSGTAEKKIVIDERTLLTNIPKVFAGGSLRRGTDPWSPVDLISDGKIAVNSINRFLQNASLTANRSGEGSYATALYTSLKDVEAGAAVKPSDPAAGYSDSEAREEAERCLLCQCLECVKECEYLAHYKGYPKKYVREVYNNLSIVMGIHHANRMINSCALCGLCSELCPNDLDMGKVNLDARKLMVERKKMPPSTHDFPLRDMAYSNSDSFLLARHQPGHDSSSMIFFPGCQLAATYPSCVKKMYEYLCEKTDGGMGLMLGCCGAPAFWGGQRELFEQTISGFRERLKGLGNPMVVTACPSCTYMLKLGLPEIKIETVWTLIDRIGLPREVAAGAGRKKLAVHDSCATRYDKDLQEGIRSIIRRCGYDVEELPGNREKTMCCGYGGLMIYANREVAHKVIGRRIAESSSDYISYCSMCRDNFASQGKRSYHMLDLLFGDTDGNIADAGVPGYSQRQENRSKLKNLMLRELWKEKVEDLMPEVKLIIPENVRSIMEDRMILVSDIEKVIAYAEETGNRLKSTVTGNYIAYHQPQRVTYWVEYSPEGDSFIVHNTYSHRLEITVQGGAE